MGKHRPGAGRAEKEEMLASLAAMVADAVAVIPQGGTMEILETGKTGDGSIHQSLKSAMDAEMSKVIMGQTLTAEVSAKAGSLAQGKVHGSILEDFRQGDQALVKAVMEEIAWLYGQINAPGVPTPRFSWFVKEDPKNELANRDKVLFATGVRFTRAYYMRKYNFQESDLDDFMWLCT